MRTGHCRVREALPSTRSLPVSRVSARAAGRNVCCTVAASAPNSPEALDVPHVQDGVGVPWAQTHALVGHIVHFHVASATGCTHEEPAQGTAKPLVCSQAWFVGDTRPHCSRHGTSPPRGSWIFPSLQSSEQHCRPRPGLCLDSCQLPPPIHRLSPGSVGSFSEQRSHLRG